MILKYAFEYAFKYALLKITGLPLVKSVHKPLAKFVLISLWLLAAASELDAAIQKKLFGSGRNLLFIFYLSICSLFNTDNKFCIGNLYPRVSL